MQDDSFIQVIILSHKGQGSVVQLVADPMVRRIVSTDKIVVEKDKAYVSSYEFELSMQYGIPWEEVLQDLKFSAFDFATELRKAGIWTFEDVSKNPKAVSSAAMQVARPAIDAVMEEAKRIRRFQGGSQ